LRNDSLSLSLGPGGRFAVGYAGGRTEAWTLLNGSTHDLRTAVLREERVIRSREQVIAATQRQHKLQTLIGQSAKSAVEGKRKPEARETPRLRLGRARRAAVVARLLVRWKRRAITAIRNVTWHVTARSPARLESRGWNSEISSYGDETASGT
jgi:hypothetical protein